jgi:hypothetical protein
MNRQLFILIITFGFTAQAQIDSALSYYPIQNGNIWQYWYHYKIAYTNSSESTYVFVKIVGDTLMPNGKWYNIVDGPRLSFLSTGYQRIDSADANIYCYSGYPTPSETLIDSLRAQVHDVFGGGILCTAADTITLFGRETVTKTFVPNAFYAPRVTFAQGIGIVKSMHLEDNPVYPVYDTYTYDLVYAKINSLEYGTLTEVSPKTKDIPTYFVLDQNYPNPFNPSTTIKFSIPTSGRVSVTIFDVLGRQVAKVIDGDYSKGEHIVRWNAPHIASGAYFYRLQTDTYSQTKRLLLQK